MTQITRKTLYSLLIFVLTLTVATITSAQTVVYDWSSTSKVPESYPKITRKQRVTFRITNVNDILYSYRLEVTQTPIEIDDFKHISGLFKVFTPSGAKTEALAECPALEDEAKSAIQKAIKEISEDPKLPIGYAASSQHKSIPLQDSIAAWRAHTAVIQEAVEAMTDLRNKCTVNGTLDQAFRAFLASAQNIEAKVNSSHVFVDTHEIAPGNNVSVMVVEMFGSETILTKTFTFPGTDILTLSAGALFSTIPDRTYESRKSPASTLNVLTVEGNSRVTPSVVALLNYSLGAFRLDNDTAGLALSAGPVLKLGSKSDASSFGFFTGLSGHLYHRFYITPGIHFGQFADFPVGFGNGSTIPANFGELTPVKRWTGRFGLAITFKTKDFSGIASSDTPTVASDAGGESKTNKKPDSSDGSSSATNAASVRNDSVARSFLKSISARPSVVITREVTEGAASDSQQAVPGRPDPRPVVSAYPDPNVRPANSYFISSPVTRSPVIHITSLDNNISRSSDERVILNAANPIQDYGMYFNGGRFYLVISHARLDVLQDGLRGHLFGEPLVEKRGDDLVLSFVLLPGTKASLVERSAGLELMLIPTTTN